MRGQNDAANLAGIPAEDPEFLYSVLNLPKTAPDQEIRERYRQLSVVFHPDKQPDPDRKEVASRQFLLVQKAYEVLSDPVTRRAYDILGAEGLSLLQSADFTHVAQEEFEQQLRRQQLEVARVRVEQALHPRGTVTIGVDASSIFDDEYENQDGTPLSPWRNLMHTIPDVKKNLFSMRHRIQKDVSSRTWVALASRVSAGAGSGGVMGTVRHQYSPRLNFEATTNLLRLSGLSLKSTYRGDPDYVVVCQSTLPAALLLQPLTHQPGRPFLLPPLNVTAYRRLFPKSPTQGMLALAVGPYGPRISVGLSSSVFHDGLPGDTASEPDERAAAADPALRAPSATGLDLYTSEWQVGFDLQGLASGLNGRYGVTFLELGVSLQTVVRWGLDGATWLVGGEWRGGDGGVGANVSVHAKGVELRLDATYHGQTLALPIVLSHVHNEQLGFWTAVLPTAALATYYYLALRPRRRRLWIEYMRKSREELQHEKSELLRQRQETLYLLQDVAARHMRAEEARDGLVILDARYGPSERGDDAEGLDVDVTVPLQALVNASQLHIPGKRSKAGIPGFYDPIAGVPKTLRVRYKFHGHAHYAEVPDHMPVVLPLKDHLVD